MQLESKLGDLKPDAHPGIPFGTLGVKTNKEMFEQFTDLLLDMVVEQLIYMAVFGQEFFRCESEELIRLGLWDPVRLFIKNEPHGRNKIEEGRLRLIANVSLRSQLIERFMCGRQNNKEISLWYRLPAKPGLGLDDDSLEHLRFNIESILQVGPIAMTDVSGWDWAVKDWLLWADAERRRLAASAEVGSMFDMLLKQRAYATARSVYGLPTGELIAQLDAGIQNSGSYCTSSTNSWMRIILFLVACMLVNPNLTDEELYALVALVMSMGDDCLERFVKGVLEKYLEMGFKCSLSATSSKLEGIEFCSHLFTNETAYPVSWPKTLYRFFSHKPGSDLPDRLAQLDFVLRHHPRKLHFMGIARTWAEQVKNLDGKEQPSKESCTCPPGCSGEQEQCWWQQQLKRRC